MHIVKEISVEEPAVVRGPLEVSVCSAQWRGRDVGGWSRC